MIGKHSTLPTNLLVLASRSGFSPRAVRKAEAEGVVLVSLDESEAAIEQRLHERLRHLRVTSFGLKVRAVVLNLRDEHGDPMSPVAGFKGNDVYFDDGTRAAYLGQIIDGYLRLPEIGTLMAAEAEKPLTEYKTAIVQFTPSVIIDGEDPPLFVRKADSGALHKIELAIVSAEVIAADEPREFTHGRLGETDVAWTKATIADSECLLVATPDQEGRLALAVKGASGETTVLLDAGSD